MTEDHVARETERLVAIGGSVGGIQAVSTLLAALPTNFPSAILVVIHTSEESPGLLPQIFRRHSRLPVVAAGRVAIEPGKVYVAIPGKHLVCTPGHLNVTEGPRENRNRPAIDPMLRSVARAYQERAIGVVLSGYLDDGTAGLAAIKQWGGIAVVQDPEEAQAPSMPLSAIANVQVDHVVTLGQLPQLLVDLVSSPPPPPRREQPAEQIDVDAERRMPPIYTCPECHGPVREVYDAGILRFECLVGHTYSSQSMLVDQRESSERALWAALRSLEEGALLARRLMQRAVELNQPYGVERFKQRAEDAERHIRVLHRLLHQSGSDDPPVEEAGAPQRQVM